MIEIHAQASIQEKIHANPSTITFLYCPSPRQEFEECLHLGYETGGKTVAVERWFMDQYISSIEVDSL